MINLSSTSEAGQHQQTRDLLKDALDALPEPVFLLHAQAATLRPLNAAAGRWGGNFPARTDGSIEAAACFPEFDLAAISPTSPRICFTHCVNSATNQPCEVELHLRPVAGDAQQMFVILRPISGLAGDEWPAHGALTGAFHDPLTGLPNRRLFARRLERAIHRSGRGHYRFAVLFIDLDNFKGLNDRFGHLHGDDILVAAGRRLLEAVRPQDMVARRDGDEFTILLDDIGHPDDAVTAAQRIVEQLQTPLTLPAGSSDPAPQVSLRASVGIACSAGDVLTANEMLTCADAAMYHAKALGGGTYMMLDGQTPVTGHKPRPR